MVFSVISRRHEPPRAGQQGIRLHNAVNSVQVMIHATCPHKHARIFVTVVTCEFIAIANAPCQTRRY
jgi:hypothetical protein